MTWQIERRSKAAESRPDGPRAIGMLRWLRSLAAPLLAAAIVSLAGCGGEDDQGAEAPEPGAPRPEAGEVAMTEYEFSPSDASVERGATIAVSNEGSIAHNLTIERGPDPTTKSERLAGTATFGPGESEELTVDLKPGEYALVCTVPGHRELGMVGSIRVR
jgi:plastocyanin